MARKKSRKRNQGRRYEAAEWVQFVLHGLAGRDVEVTAELQDAAANFEAAVEEAVATCVRKYPPKGGAQATIDELRDEGANTIYDVYATLAGEGVGIWDGRWDAYYPNATRAHWDKLKKCLRKELSWQYGALESALVDAAFADRDDNPIKDMPGGSVSGCIKAQKRKPKGKRPCDAGAYCAAIADRIEPGWRSHNPARDDGVVWYWDGDYVGTRAVGVWRPAGAFGEYLAGGVHTLDDVERDLKRRGYVTSRGRSGRPPSKAPTKAAWSAARKKENPRRAMTEPELLRQLLSFEERYGRRAWFAIPRDLEDRTVMPAVEAGWGGWRNKPVVEFKKNRPRDKQGRLLIRLTPLGRQVAEMHRASNPYQGDAVELAKYRKKREEWERKGKKGPPPVQPEARGTRRAARNTGTKAGRAAHRLSNP